MMRASAAVVLAAAALALVLPVPGSARADSPSICDPPTNWDCTPDPAGYLNQLKSAGISGNSDQTLIHNGQAICGDIANGVPSADEAAGLQQTNPSLTYLQTNAAVDTALTYLCPRLITQDMKQILVMLPPDALKVNPK